MKALLSLFVLLLINAQVNAQTTWEVDAVHSNVNFTVTHLVVSEVNGRFKDFSIKVVNSKDDFTDAQAEVTIKTASISTDNEKRDGHLRSEDFFFAEKYPEIKFVSKSFKKIDDKNYKITGDLTMRGVTKTVELNGVYRGSIKDGYGNFRVAWSVTGSVNRFDYGLNWNALIEAGGAVVGETVNLQLNVELIKKQ